MKRQTVGNPEKSIELSSLKSGVKKSAKQATKRSSVGCSWAPLFACSEAKIGHDVDWNPNPKEEHELWIELKESRYGFVCFKCHALVGCYTFERGLLFPDLQSVQVERQLPSPIRPTRGTEGWVQLGNRMKIFVNYCCRRRTLVGAWETKPSRQAKRIIKCFHLTERFQKCVYNIKRCRRRQRSRQSSSKSTLAYCVGHKRREDN